MVAIGSEVSDKTFKIYYNLFLFLVTVILVETTLVKDTPRTIPKFGPNCQSGFRGEEQDVNIGWWTSYK